MAKPLNVEKPEREVEAVYRHVGETPTDERRFETGRSLAADGVKRTSLRADKE